jgi:FAD:protein FMN transferase
MKRTWQVMGMPVTLIINDGQADEAAFQVVKEYFTYVDETYSPFKPDSQVTHINDGLPRARWTAEMKSIWRKCETTKRETDGYFDVMHEGRFDPSGLVKGWAISNAAGLLRRQGITDFYVEAGGDIQVSGRDGDQPWRIGIRNPFDRHENVKIVELSDHGIATSGTYIRGQHIYNPHDDGEITDVASLTVIGPSIYDADRYATAAFAMGRRGIDFIESLPDFEAYMITPDQRATLTSGFERYAGVAV